MTPLEIYLTEQVERLAREVGTLTSLLREANLSKEYRAAAPTSPFYGEHDGGRVFEAEVAGVKYHFSTLVEEGEPEVRDLEHAHPGSPTTVTVTHVWLFGTWIEAEGLLSEKLLESLDEQFTRGYLA